MKVAHSDKIRNIALIAHQSAGKTTLAESMLHRMGVTTRMGAIEEGNTVCDYHADEISRQMSISTTIVNGNHKDIKINLLDTPGFTDFSGEVKGAVRVADTAGVLINAASGIEVGTELVWRFAKEINIPRFFFMNHLDKENVEFDSVLESLKERFGSIAQLQFPVNPGSDKFNQIVDLIAMKLITYNPDGGVKSTGDIPGELKEKADTIRMELVESVAENDEDLMEIFFENDGLSAEELITGLRKGFRDGTLYPLVCGAAKRQVGTSLLLDFIMNVVPSPVDLPDFTATKEAGGEEVTKSCDTDGTFASLVFKTVSDKHVGDLSFFRVYSGSLTGGTDCRNTTRGQTEKIGQVFTVTGKNRVNVDSIIAGDMGALVKLKDTHTSDTLSEAKDGLVLKEIDFPETVARTAIVPRNKGDEEKISSALHILHEEDRSFNFEYNPELKQLLVSGQGELHLNIIMERLKDRFGVEVDQEVPHIPYRETIKSAAEGQGKYKKQSGGRGQYGDCWLRLESQKRGEDIEFIDAIVGGVIPGKFVPAVEKGVRMAIGDGVISGNQVVDVKVTCFDGSYHTVDSSENAFKMAGSMAFKKIFKDAKPVLLEPVEDLEVRVPDEFMGDVMGDISAKRGKIMGMEQEGNYQLIRAKAPLTELHMYSSTLRSLTGGRGLHRQSFSHYEEVPHEIQAKIVEEWEAKRAEGIA